MLRRSNSKYIIHEETLALRTRANSGAGGVAQRHAQEWKSTSDTLPSKGMNGSQKLKIIVRVQSLEVG